jgi:hypothetical protein
MVADCHSILARWRNHFSQLFNVHEVNEVRQTEIQAAEPPVPEPSDSEGELAIAKLKRHKSPGTDQVPAELIKAAGRTTHWEIHKFIKSIWNKEELPEEWKESITVPIYTKGDNTDCSNYSGISLLPTTYKILSNILLSRLTPYAEKSIGDHQCGFRRNRSTTDHIFCIHQILEKKLQFLPYGRSIGSWICLTHKTYTCHTVQNITDTLNIVRLLRCTLMGVWGSMIY